MIKSLVGKFLLLSLVSTLIRADDAIERSDENSFYIDYYNTLTPELKPEIEPELKPEIEPELKPEIEPEREPEIEPEPEQPNDIDKCTYPDIDFLSDRIIDYMATLIPGEMDVKDDKKGKMASKNTRVKGLDSFYRTGRSTYECTEKGLQIRVPIKFSKAIISNFSVSPNWKLKTWIPMNGVINSLSAEAIMDVVFVGQPAVHLVNLKVTDVKDIELGIRGNNFFARGVRKLISLITNEFKNRIKRCVEKTLREILEEKLVTVPLKYLGFNK